ncbi:hypothetical protein Tco_0805474 [Tanacetum coccineum]
MYTRYGGALSIAGTGISSISLRESGRRSRLPTPRRMCSTYTEDELMVIVPRGQAARAHSRCWSDDKFSQMLSQLESQPEIGGGSGSGGRGDDEQGDDEDDGEDGED